MLMTLRDRLIGGQKDLESGSVSVMVGGDQPSKRMVVINGSGVIFGLFPPLRKAQQKRSSCDRENLYFSILLPLSISLSPFLLVSKPWLSYSI